jgi:hypothetical protein
MNIEEQLQGISLSNETGPAVKRVQTAIFIVHNEQIYRLYVARVTWPNGSTQDFPSEEHAHAHIENREISFVPFKTF